LDGPLGGPAGHHLRTGAWLGDESKSDAGPGRAVLHAGQPVAIGTNVLDVEADPVIRHREPDCSSILKGELEPPKWWLGPVEREAAA
jgi:hypothetical protein